MIYSDVFLLKEQVNRDSDICASVIDTATHFFLWICIAQCCKQGPYLAIKT